MDSSPTSGVSQQSGGVVRRACRVTARGASGFVLPRRRWSLPSSPSLGGRCVGVVRFSAPLFGAFGAC